MSQTNRVLIIDEMHESIEPLLTEAGYDPDYRPTIERHEIVDQIGNCVGLIFRGKISVDEELIDAGTELKFVARAGAGMDKVDKEYLEKRNIIAINAPEGNRDALGEHALGMLLSLLHRIHWSDHEVRSGLWKREENRGIELGKRTVGIYGYGNMGMAFANKLKGLGCEVLAYDKYKSGFSDEYVKEVDLDDFRNEVEILSLHIPLNDETRFLFDLEELNKYAKLLFLLNTARGKVLRLNDALTLLENGKLLGLALDVLENEKIDQLSEVEKTVFERLTARNDTLITPHIGGWTNESYERINHVLVKKIKELQLL